MREFKGFIVVEVNGLKLERFLNLCWSRGVSLRNVYRENLTNWRLEVDVKGYKELKSIANETNVKVKIVRRKGVIAYASLLKRKVTLIGGGVIFLGILYLLSTYIWSIDIYTDKYLSPYEIRRLLISEGINPGVNKSKVNIYELEKKILDKDSRVMWVRARIEGGTLKINIEERQNPPVLEKEKTKGDVVAKMDGQILRIYTISGTPIVQKGDMVKGGEVIIKGIQGKEGSEYETYAQGDVFAKTYYEDNEVIKIKGVKRERTGEVKNSLYLDVMDKKLFLKKTMEPFAIYDKEEGGNFLKKVIYYEIKEKPFELNIEEEIQKAALKMENNIIKNIDKSAKILDKVITKELNEDTLNVKMVFIVEQNIAEKSEGN